MTMVTLMVTRTTKLYRGDDDGDDNGDGEDDNGDVDCDGDDNDVYHLM